MILGLLVGNALHAKVVEYVQDPYAMNAPADIVAMTEGAAHTMHFDKSYEVVVPTKAGMQINPWNKFIASGVNNQTGNFFIIMNPAWFSLLPLDQQQFLLARVFASFELGNVSFAMKAVPYIFLLFFMALMFCVIFTIVRRPLSRKKKLLAIVIAWIAVALFNATLQSRLQPFVVHYFGLLHDNKINELALQRTGNRDAAVQALASFDAAIKEDLKDGNTFWKPFETVFEHQAKQLRK